MCISGRPKQGRHGRPPNKSAKDLIDTATASRGRSGYAERWTRSDRAKEAVKEIAQAKATSEEVHRNIRCVIDRAQTPVPVPVEDTRLRYRGRPEAGGLSLIHIV